MRTISAKHKLNWNRIRAEYIGGGCSYRSLSEKYGVPFGTLRIHAEKEHWREEREKAAQEVNKRAAQETAEHAALNAVKLEKVREKLIDKILAIVEQIPDKSGTHIRQSQIDRDTGRQIAVDYDLMQLVQALEKLSTGGTADLERQKKFAEENNATLMSYADLFSKAARQRTIDELENATDIETDGDDGV